MTLYISSAFDGGNINVITAQQAGDICLSIEPDNANAFYQWFYYRLTGAKDQDCRMVITNAAGAAYTGGWDGYRVAASYDREHWFRVKTTAYENGQLIINHKPAQDHVYYAYFAPYSMERHADLIADCLQYEGVFLRVLGHSLEGQSIDCLSLGTGPKHIWVIARQHPGETMAQWWMEGFLARLLDADDEIAAAMRKAARFHIIPNMNPDGSRRGNLRTNYSGANLNREWGVARADKSPEVLCTMTAMDAAKPDLVLDVHGDETLPYNFIAGTQGIPGFSDKQARNLADFLEAYKRASDDFQTQHGYPVNAAGKANLTMCSNYTAHRYDCLSMTLEMPFKDNADAPDAAQGWSPERSAQLGGAVLDAMLDITAQL